MTLQREERCRQYGAQRLGTFNNGCVGWEIWLDGEWSDIDAGWAVFHPEIGMGIMPNEGRFDTWREAMAFVDEYIRAAEWNSDLVEVEDTGAAWLPPVSSNAPNYAAARAELQ